MADPVAAVSRELAGQALAREHEPAQRLEVGRQPGEQPAFGFGGAGGQDPACLLEVAGEGVLSWACEEGKRSRPCSS